MSTRSVYSRMFATAVAVAAVAVGAAVSFATPAQALPPSLTIAVSPAGVAPTSAVAVATCPAGSRLVGAGGQIIPSSGNVVMTDVIPDVGAGTVTVWGHEKGAFALNWQVSAAAICDTQITGVVRVGVISPNNPVASKTVNPVCPAGTTLSGTGYQLTGGMGEVFPDDVIPNPALDGSSIAAFANGGFAANWQLTGYAICANVPAGATPIRMANAGPVNMGSPKNEVAACPNTTNLVGVGGNLTGGLGNVVLDQLMPNPVLTEATARGNEFANANWNVTSYAICW
jgi:hypothetical protein